ncbi:MAG: hypothetical protein PHU05_04595 [Bacilli bacterium]|nr:hypothetical protein [Bacilli bacterium]
MGRGSYSNGFKRGPFFFKIIDPTTKIEEIIYAGLNSNPKVIKDYIKDIKKLNIKCARMYLVSNKVLIEEYIKGQTVDEYLNDNISDDLKIDMTKKILDLFKKSLKNSDLRIDWNLRNFIVKDNDVVLVDYVPSLYIKNLNKIKQNPTIELYDLYLNLDIQLAGIIGYSVYPFIEYEKNLFKKIYEDIYSYASSIYKIDKTKKHIFVERINLIDKYLNNKVDKDEFILNFKSMSLSKKMQEKLNRG